MPSWGIRVFWWFDEKCQRSCKLFEFFWSTNFFTIVLSLIHLYVFNDCLINITLFIHVNYKTLFWRQLVLNNLLWKENQCKNGSVDVRSRCYSFNFYLLGYSLKKWAGHCLSPLTWDSLPRSSEKPFLTLIPLFRWWCPFDFWS